MLFFLLGFRKLYMQVPVLSSFPAEPIPFSGILTGISIQVHPT
jgi:hypothetical protein